MSKQKITFFNEDDEEIEFYVVEQTRLAGVNYLLVADSEDEEAEALILKENPGSDGDEDALYDIVEDDDELAAVSQVFSDMVDDLDIEIH